MAAFVEASASRPTGRAPRAPNELITPLGEAVIRKRSGTEALPKAKAHIISLITKVVCKTL
jgi:hypothetical protein